MVINNYGAGVMKIIAFVVLDDYLEPVTHDSSSGQFVLKRGKRKGSAGTRKSKESSTNNSLISATNVTPGMYKNSIQGCL